MKLSVSSVLVAAACIHSVAAVNVIFFTSPDCSSGNNAIRYFCLGLSPETCCGIDSPGHRTVEFQQVPTNQNLELRSYGGGRCSRRSAEDGSEGRGTICFKREPPYTGAGYGRFTRKRNDFEDGADKGECVRPQQMELGDGSKFNLTSLSDADYAKM
jgi:hypothetical protein